jgi:PKD repeat protein
MGRLYISFGQESREWALKIRNALRETGHAVWLDCIEKPRNSKEAERFRRALAQSRVVVLLVSPSSVRAARVRRCLMAARQLNKFIIPITVLPVSGNPALDSRNHIDATTDPDRAIARLVQAANYYTRQPRRKNPPAVAQANSRRRIAALALFIAIFLTWGIIGVFFTQVDDQGQLVAGNTFTGITMPETTALLTDTQKQIDSNITEISSATGEIKDEAAATDDDPASQLNDTTSSTPEMVSSNEFALTPTPTDGEVITVDDPDNLTTPTPTLDYDDEPIASFDVGPAFGDAPLTVTFTNDSLGNISHYAWDFNGDGNIDSTSSNPPPYTYHQPGTYIASLTVSGSTQNLTDTYTVSLIVYDADDGFLIDPTPAPSPSPTPDYNEPIASFDVNPAFGDAPLTVTFTNDSLGNISHYAWDFNGDGRIDSTSPNPMSYTYQQPGIYEPSLTVSGVGGESTSYVTTIVVYEPEIVAEPPDARFAASPTSGYAPLTVGFANQSTGEITGYAWDFNGDGIVDSTVENAPAYTYHASGTYSATLTVSGPGGVSTPYTVTITVEQPPTPTATATLSPTATTTLPAPESVTESPAPTATSSPTDTATSTSTPDVPSLTPSPTDTGTTLPTATHQPTETTTPTFTETPTASPTLTPTSTPTETEQADDEAEVDG